MKNKKKLIIFLVLIVVISIILITTVIILQPKKEKNNTRIESIEYLANYIKKINSLNSKFNVSNLNEKNSYTNEKNNLCKMYGGSDTQTVITNIEELYDLPFSLSRGIFEIVETEIPYNSGKNKIKTEVLYVCLPKNCEIKEITNYEFDFIDAEFGQIIVEGKEFGLKRIDDENYKIVFPIVNCK